MKEKVGDRAPLFAVGICMGLPFASWLKLSTYHELVRGLRTFGTILSGGLGIFLCILACVVLVSIPMNLQGRRNERRLLNERGKQTRSDFESLFFTNSERRAANLLYPVLQEMTLTGQLPLRLTDSLRDEPLNIDDEDLYFEIIELCETLDICPALSPKSAQLLFSAPEVGQLVAALAAFLEEQAPCNVLGCR